MSSTLLLLNQNIVASFYVITCHQNEKIQFIKCRVPLNMSLVLRVSTFSFEFSFWTHNFFTGFQMIAETINQGSLICAALTLHESKVK